jgi:hypothetical protein
VRCRVRLTFAARAVVTGTSRLVAVLVPWRCPAGMCLSPTSRGVWDGNRGALNFSPWCFPRPCGTVSGGTTGARALVVIERFQVPPWHFVPRHNQIGTREGVGKSVSA